MSVPDVNDVAVEREELREGETEIEDRVAQLWRQVHPTHVSRHKLKDVVGPDAFQELVGPGAFSGTSAAKYEVSTSMASVVDAKEAYEHYTESLQLTSAGTYTVTVGVIADTEARVIDDSKLQTGENPVRGHAYIDLRGMPRTLQRRARSTMADYATKIGRVYPEM